MERLQLEVEERNQAGQSAAKKLREEGLIPGVVYGKNQEPVNVKVNDSDLEDIVGGNAIIDLELDDEPRTVMIKEVQRDVITGDFLHVDFHQIALDESIAVEVPIALEGTAEGQREGGVLQQTLRKIEVECLPTEIPEKIEVDISELEVGQSLHVADLDPEEDVEILTAGDEVLVTVVVPTELDLEEEEEEEEVITEPEVIGEEPEEGEEEAEEEMEEEEVEEEF